jgi:hypothetical protein
MPNKKPAGNAKAPQATAASNKGGKKGGKKLAPAAASGSNSGANSSEAAVSIQLFYKIPYVTFMKY